MVYHKGRSQSIPDACQTASNLQQMYSRQLQSSICTHMRVGARDCHVRKKVQQHDASNTRHMSCFVSFCPVLARTGSD